MFEGSISIVKSCNRESSLVIPILKFAFELAQKTEKKLLKNINLFDVYTGSKLPEGKKSYALSFTIQDEKRTLTDKQIDKIMKKLQQNFESEFGASLR